MSHNYPIMGQQSSTQQLICHNQLSHNQFSSAACPVVIQQPCQQDSNMQDRLNQFWTETEPKIRNEATDEIDKTNGKQNDCQQVTEYLRQITKNMKEEGCQSLPKPNYMATQNDIDERMRGILIDWVIEIHLKFRLVPETLFLAVNLIDRYLSKT